MGYNERKATWGIQMMKQLESPFFSIDKDSLSPSETSGDANGSTDCRSDNAVIASLVNLSVFLGLRVMFFESSE